MIFGILATITVIAALAMGGVEFKEQYVGNKRKLNGKMFGHATGVALITFTIFAFGSAIVMGVARMVATELTANQLNVVSSDVYKLAANSDLDASDNLKFIAVAADGSLEPKTIDYTSLTIDSLQANRVEVLVVDHVYTVVAPFPLKTTTTVVVK